MPKREMGWLECDFERVLIKTVECKRGEVRARRHHHAPVFLLLARKSDKERLLAVSFLIDKKNTSFFFR